MVGAGTEMCYFENKKHKLKKFHPDKKKSMKSKRNLNSFNELIN
jgi:hypothetical protein